MKSNCCGAPIWQRDPVTGHGHCFDCGEPCTPEKEENMEKKIKYIEKAGRKLVVEFFHDGAVKAVHEWTGAPTAAHAVKLEGERYANSILFLASNFKRRAYHDEFARLRRKYGREFITPEDVEKARRQFDNHSAEQKALSAINAPCFMIDPCFERSLIMQV